MSEPQQLDSETLARITVCGLRETADVLVLCMQASLREAASKGCTISMQDFHDQARDLAHINGVLRLYGKPPVEFDVKEMAA
jgi:hypothetical protein